MRTNPEPMHTAIHRNAQCSVVQPYPDAVESALTNGFEVQRRMGRVFLQQRIVSVRQCLHLGW